MAKIKTIVVEDLGHSIRDEADASEAITPGHLVELETAGTVKKNTVTTGNISVQVALEDSLQGKDISEDYASGDRVQYQRMQSGSLVLLVLADGQNATIGSRLAAVSGGEVTVSNTASIATVRNAVDASDSATTPLADRRVVALVI